MIRPDLKAAPAKIGGSNLKAVRRPLQRSRDSAMLAVPGWPKWKFWFRTESSELSSAEVLSDSSDGFLRWAGCPRTTSK